MPKPIRKEVRVESAQPESPEETKEPKKEEPKKEKSEKDLHSWNFPLKGRTVKARTLAEAIKKVNAKE